MEKKDPGTEKKDPGTEKKDSGTEKKDPGTEKMYPGAKKRIRVLTKKDPGSGVNLALADINNFHTKTFEIPGKFVSDTFCLTKSHGCKRS